MITGEERAVARRLWPDDEETDFTVAVVPGDPAWIRLSCSVHGPVIAAVTWDLGELLVAAERHYVTRHLRPNRAARPGECSFCSGGMADYCTCPPEEAP